MNISNNGFDSPTVNLSPVRKQISPAAVHQWDDASDVTETTSNCRGPKHLHRNHTDADSKNQEDWLANCQRYNDRKGIGDGDTADISAYKNHYLIKARREASDKIQSIYREEETAFESYVGRMNEIMEDSCIGSEDAGDRGAVRSDRRSRDIRENGSGDILGANSPCTDDSECCQPTSQCCGVYEVQDLLTHSAKWFCHNLRTNKLNGDAVPKMLEDEAAAILIQTKWRSYIAAKHYRKTKESVLVYFNISCAEEEEKGDAAVVIQSMWRKSAATRQYAEIIGAVVAIQSRWRRGIAMKQYAKRFAALLVIQSFVRCKLWERHLMNDEDSQSDCDERDRAAILCQSHIRRMLASNKVQKARLRNLQIRQQVTEEESAIKCQCAVRKWIALRQYSEVRENICHLINQKHVARTGQIELILNDATAAETADETLTHYSEVSAAEDFSPLMNDEDWRSKDANTTSNSNDYWLSNCQRYISQKHLQSHSIAQVGLVELELILDTTTAETADETLTHCSDISSDPNPTRDETCSCSAATAETPEVIRFTKDEEPPAYSRCGLSDSMHEILLESGKRIYEWVGDPDYETAVDLLRLMERAEQSGFCCGRRGESEGSSGWGCHG